MTDAIIQGILTKLNADTTLTTLLGGTYCYKAGKTQAAAIPSVTVKEMTGKSVPRTGYTTTLKRDAPLIVQVDIWVSSEQAAAPCTEDDSDAIAERIDAVLLDARTPVSDTWNWEKTTSSQQHEDDTQIWHTALRYTLDALITDS